MTDNSVNGHSVWNLSAKKSPTDLFKDIYNRTEKFPIVHSDYRILRFMDMQILDIRKALYSWDMLQ